MVDFVTDDALRACGAEVGARQPRATPTTRSTPRADGSNARGDRRREDRSGRSRRPFADARLTPTRAPARFGDAASRAPKGASPEEVTRLGHDPAARLRRALATANGDWRRLLGETQVAFSLFLALGSAPAFEHWKAMTAMLCDASAEARAGDPFLSLYDGFIRAFASQLDLAEGVDGASDVVREGRFLGTRRRVTRGAGEALRGARGQTAARARRSLQVLEAVATRRFGIETPRTRAKRSFFGGRETGEFLAAGDAGGGGGPFPFDEDDEDAPVVVELAEGTYARMDAGAGGSDEDGEGRCSVGGGDVRMVGGEGGERGGEEAGGRMGWMLPEEKTEEEAEEETRGENVRVITDFNVT